MGASGVITWVPLHARWGGGGPGSYPGHWDMDEGGVDPAGGRGSKRPRRHQQTTITTLLKPPQTQSPRTPQIELGIDVADRAISEMAKTLNLEREREASARSSRGLALAPQPRPTISHIEDRSRVQIGAVAGATNRSAPSLTTTPILSSFALGTPAGGAHQERDCLPITKGGPFSPR